MPKNFLEADAHNKWIAKKVPYVKYNFSKEEFENALENLDRDFIKKGIDPQFRPIHVMTLISSQLPILKDACFLPYCNEFFVSGIYTSYNLGTLINKWFKLRYGNKLSLGERAIVGRMILLIRGEPYIAIFPVIFGTVKITWEVKNIQLPNDTINLVNKIENLTFQVANSLTKDEIYKLLEVYNKTYAAMYKFYESGMLYSQEALEDEHQAVDGIFHSYGFGQSKWDSLQFTEKLLKGLYFKIENKKPQRTHCLNKLADLLPTLNIDKQSLNKINCSAGVRYGEIKVNKQESIDAHLASMKILRDVMV